MPRNLPTDKSAANNELPWESISWWLMLATAVIAIPGLAFAIVTVTGVEGIVGIMVFMFACWGCTYFGMHLMKHPSMREKYDITETEESRYK